MIESFGNRLAEDLFYDRPSKEVRQFPPELRRVARRKLLYLHAGAELMDLTPPPGQRLGVYLTHTLDEGFKKAEVLPLGGFFS